MSELQPNDKVTLERIRGRVDDPWAPPAGGFARHYREDVRFLIDRIDELTLGVVAAPPSVVGALTCPDCDGRGASEDWQRTCKRCNASGVVASLGVVAAPVEDAGYMRQAREVHASRRGPIGDGSGEFRPTKQGEEERFAPVESGEWILPPLDKPFLMECCDCSLVHALTFDHDDEGRIIFAAERANDETDRQRAIRGVVAEPTEEAEADCDICGHPESVHEPEPGRGDSTWCLTCENESRYTSIHPFQPAVVAQEAE